MFMLDNTALRVLCASSSWQKLVGQNMVRATGGYTSRDKLLVKFDTFGNVSLIHVTLHSTRS